MATESGSLTRSTNWEGAATQSAKEKTYTFSTANKLVDKNIALKVTVSDGALSASGTATATTTVAPGDVTIAANTTAVSGKTRIASTPSTATSGISTYYIAVKANAAANSTGATSSISGTATASVTTSGYVTKGTTTGTGSVTGTATAKTSSKDSSVYYLPIPTGSPAFDGGAVTIKASSTSATGSNLAITDTDTDTGSGIYITTAGSATPTRAAVLYNGAVDGYVVKADNTSALAAGDGSATSLTTNKYYVTSATIATSKTFTVNMQTGATLRLVDSINNKTWIIKTDSSNNALTIEQE